MNKETEFAFPTWSRQDKLFVWPEAGTLTPSISLPDVVPDDKRPPHVIPEPSRAMLFLVAIIFILLTRR